MPATVLRIDPENIDTPEKRGRITLCIIGCGNVGLVQACLFADAGFKVLCADADQTLLNNVARGKLSFLGREVELRLKNYVKKGLLKTSNDLKAAVSQSDVIIIAVPVEIDAKKKLDYSRIEGACKNVGSSLHQGVLVIITSIVGVGMTEGLIKETLENTSGFKVGIDFGLGYSPFQDFSADSSGRVPNHEQVIAALDKNSLNATSLILGTIVNTGLKRIENTKTAEAVVLFQEAQQIVSNALAKELAFLCEKMGIDYLETRKVVESNGSSKLSSLTLADENTHSALSMLLEEAENLNLKLRLPVMAREVEEEAANHSVNLIKDALRNCGKTLRRARISLLGITESPNTKGPPRRIALKLVKILEAKGAKVSLYDPYLSSDELNQIGFQRSKNLATTLEGADCIVILTGHEQFKRLNLKKVRITAKMPIAIVDLEGTVELGKVEEEGFIYRGFGRGVWIR
jgi:nucleotide sugar dehydrogenase